MAKRRFQLSEQQRDALLTAYLECEDGETRTRFQAVRLYGMNYPVATIQEVTGCSTRSLLEGVRVYRHTGLEALCDHRVGGNSAKLTPEQRTEVEARLHQFTPKQILRQPYTRRTVLDDRRPSGCSGAMVRGALRPSHFVLQPVAHLRLQLSAHRKSLQVTTSRANRRLSGNGRKKLLEVAQDAPHTVILTEDEASLYLQATRQKVWSPQGQTPCVRVDASRTKTNFYGSLNLQTGCEVVLRAEKLNGATTAGYLARILEAYPDVPILMFWDRAPWHRGAAIEQVLRVNPRLEIMWYPVAAPELNPQEHVWKATRRAVSHNHNQPRMEPLADQFEKHLVSTRFTSSFLDQYGYNSIRAMFI